MSINKKGFTLVELIVVITILAILGTIAFISLQGYSMDARNSNRLSDLKSIEKILSFNQVQRGFFALPTYSINVSYSGSKVWTQGSFGMDTKMLLGDRGNISKVPTDPLTSNEYTYSLLNNKKEISLAAVFEEEMGYNNNLINSSYAAGIYGTVKIIGNYNGKIAKASSGATTYILAVPTIISGDITLLDIIDIINSNELVYDSYGTLPSTYLDGVFTDNNPSGDLVNVSDIVVFSGSLEDLNGGDIQDEIIDNLQKAYSGTIIKNKPQIKEILTATDDDKQYIAQVILKKTIDNKVELTALSVDNSSVPAFISTWDTTKPGSTNNDQIKIPLLASGNYDFTVDWGDGTTNDVTVFNQVFSYKKSIGNIFSFLLPETKAMMAPSGGITHTYASAGIYDVTITGTIEGFSFNWTGDAQKIIDIKSWGPLKLGNDGGYFAGCYNLTGLSITDNLDLSGTTNLDSMFSYAFSFNGDIKSWDVSNVNNMTSMFQKASSFNQNIDSWDVGNVDDMSRMFNQATIFDQNINSWNVSNVNNMAHMLPYTNFNQDISSWNVTNVNDMQYMFQGTVFFNQDISSWDVSNVNNMNAMFTSAQSFDKDISSWNVNNVTNYSSFSTNTLSSWTVGEKPSF